MSHQLVLARYNEDVTWAKDIADCIIYNKGATLNDPRQVLLKENPPWRESHTFLTHIVRNYDNLADYTTFAQAHPFDHCKNFLDRWQDEHDFCFVADWIVADNEIGIPHHPSLPLGWCFEQIWQKPAHNCFIFGAGAQFTASRERIHFQEREFYEKVNAFGYWVNAPTQWANCMERLWWDVLHTKHG
jgi:Protein of unknown function (DUF3431)